MPRYHFNTEDGRFVADRDGVDLVDLEAARIEAVRLLGRVLCDNPDIYWEHEHFAIIVTDDAREPLFAINLGPDP
jgi:hypothetical protein